MTTLNKVLDKCWMINPIIHQTSALKSDRSFSRQTIGALIASELTVITHGRSDEGHKNLGCKMYCIKNM